MIVERLLPIALDSENEPEPFSAHGETVLDCDVGKWSAILFGE